MKRRSRKHVKISYFAGPAARKGKDKGEQQQQQQRTSSVSSGDEISATHSVSSSEESTGSPSRPPKKVRRRNIHAMLMPDAKSSFELGKQHQVQQKKSSKGKINVEDVQVSSGVVQGPNLEEQIEHSGGFLYRPASNSEGGVQVAKLEWDFLKFCLDYATLPKVETKKKPKSSSGDPSSIAHDEDEHSGKNTSCGHLGNMIAQGEDGQHSENIVAPVIEDHKEKKGRVVEHAQALLDMDKDAFSKKFFSCMIKCERILPDDCNPWPFPSYEPDQQAKVYEQLALYRIRGYQLSLEDRQLAELDDENLKKKYSPTDLSEEGYFQYYEKDLEWYFDPELCMDPEFDNYQRLVLKDFAMGSYLEYDYYRKIRNTYEKDIAYVQYYEALVNETKWLEDLRRQGTEQDRDKWIRVRDVVKIQALQIAEGFPYVSMPLVSFAVNELLWKIESDYRFYKYTVCKFFEIWKQTAKLKMDLRQAYLEVFGENYPFGCFKSEFNTFIAGIDETASDDQAHQQIMEGFLKKIPRAKIYLDYIKDKIHIAKAIMLID